MNKNMSAILSGLAGVGVALALTATAAGAATPTEMRQAAMKAVGQSMKDGAAINSGKTPYDPAKAKAVMGGLSTNVKKLHALFPAGSGGDPKTEALPAVWTNKADFTKRIDELAKLADTASKAPNAAAFKPAFQAVGGTCKGCHDLYRKKAS